MAETRDHDLGWAWFEPAAAPEPDAALREAYRHCFTTPAGQRVLRHLRGLTLDRALGPHASPCTLRHLEGQRALVAMVLRLSVP